jgi:hypothetical protein
MRLEELAAKKVNEFAFMMQPLKIQGARARPSRPSRSAAFPQDPPRCSRGSTDAAPGSSRFPTTRASTTPAGTPAGGVIMIRPDGHIGFRYPSTQVDALTALDRHLSSYLHHRRSGSG